jgi:hypothetical protein
MRGDLRQRHDPALDTDLVDAIDDRHQDAFRTLSLSRGRPLSVANTNSSTLSGLRPARHAFSSSTTGGRLRRSFG